MLELQPDSRRHSSSHRPSDASSSSRQAPRAAIYRLLNEESAPVPQERYTYTLYSSSVAAIGAGGITQCIGSASAFGTSPSLHPPGLAPVSRDTGQTHRARLHGHCAICFCALHPMNACALVCKLVGPTCKQCEAKIDPLLLNPQRSTTDPRARLIPMLNAGKKAPRATKLVTNLLSALINKWIAEKEKPADLARRFSNMKDADEIIERYIKKLRAIPKNTSQAKRRRFAAVGPWWVPGRAIVLPRALLKRFPVGPTSSQLLLPALTPYIACVLIGAAY
ncbi:uncharacterized protein PITG_12015 [Phytophthora infestans T30-4]|uniref:Uncharacterized protein n=1 Tax=Phytophthora infestans (strain T30-4) TaxID=403677 RepID=D0NHR3_PHYIT|nr:uncharacterized protein PITG_12015 [Phytophthora infestans T30-4]EEY58988.1 hypothetical protein PITG_12015 [Phytophthora infestans T30-4]|eukprot:XP_002901461.1 hypothetical protein PITG_12015 [Phytophthora infestans T30-4]